tara:strand:+ start:55 stop:732 length:678 start_codon:yes stop_codon:yes gene_type:complete
MSLVLKVPKDKSAMKKEKEQKKSSMIGIYFPSMLTRRVAIPMKNVGDNVIQVLEKIIRTNYEGKCVQEGFIKPNSSKILTYSSGQLQADSIVFEVVFECLICCPVEGMLISCIAKNITKAGIKAEVETGDAKSPVVIFVSRDHHFKDKTFAKVKEEDSIRIRVIGQRYELNDASISIIGELVEIESDKPKNKTEKIYSKPKGRTGSPKPKKKVKKLVVKPKKIQE